MQKVYCIVQYEDHGSDFYQVLYTYASEDEAKEYLDEKATCWDFEAEECTKEESFERKWIGPRDASWGLVTLKVY